MLIQIPHQKIRDAGAHSPSTTLSFFSQGPLVAIIADTYGDKTVSILGAFLISGGFLISSQATSIPFLCVTIGVLPGEFTVKVRL